MRTIKDTQAGPQLPRLIAETAEAHEPIQITGDKANGVLLADERATGSNRK